MSGAGWLWLIAAVWVPQYFLLLVLHVVSLGWMTPLLVAGCAFTTLVGALGSWGLYQLRRRMSARSLARRVGSAAAAVLTVSVLYAALSRFLLIRIIVAFEPGHSPPDGGVIDVLVGSLQNLSLFGLYLAAAELIFVVQRGRDADRLLAQARDDARQAQIAALRFQLNPHFLFNTLNAVSGLILTGRADRAEAVIGRLSSFLRASLASDLDDLVTVAEEFDTLHDYLEIESARFGERLQVELDCAGAAADALVPSLLVQPLVENAVKYAVAPSRRPVSVRVEAAVEVDVLVLRVSDDGGDPGAPAPTAGAGVGLKNVRNRLERFYGGRGTLRVAASEQGFIAEVRLPLQRARGDDRRYA